jgi:methylmalonyl-CoA mutase cobalamin-binding subunit
MKTIVAGALGECVHVAGVMNFLRLAESAGWRIVFLGPAISIKKILEIARRENADLVGVSYRLTPETGERLLAEFAEEADDLRTAGVRFVFGGTPPVAERAQAIGFFERVFEGGEPAEMVLAYLKGQHHAEITETDFPQTSVERIAWKAPFPIIRHHFGLPTVESTRAGIARIAQAQVLDVISMPAGAATFLFCAPTLAATTLFGWPRCTWRRSTSPGAPFPSSGSTRWMAAAPGTWKTLSVNIRK